MENQHASQVMAEGSCSNGDMINVRNTSLEASGNQEVPVKSRNKKEVADKVPYCKLFSLADSVDVFLMVVGTVTAVASGICVPLLAVVLGETINSFGKTLDRKEIVHEVSKVSLKFVYLALSSGVTSFFQVACWTITGERQAARMRSSYLRSLLMQDIAFFDKETSTGEIIERISRDTIIIQDAMGEKVGKFIQLSASFFGGFIIAFIKGWLLSLVMLSSIPPLVLTAFAMTILMAKLASHGQAAYSAAATLVEQTLSAIRTVASFTGEMQAIAEYDKSLNKAYKSGVQEGLAAGLGSGVFMFVFYCCYGLAIWVGAKMILEKHYSGGDVLNVTLAILTGSFSIGQASPCLSAFALGQAAAFRMFQIMNRKPLISPSILDGLKLDNMVGTIELKNVYFSYPARVHERILSEFSLFIKSGTTAALVGRSGSGKSTVLSLIERFYDPQAGEVLLDGINIKDFQLKWIRSKIGLVSQEPILFASSIRENIAYGKDNASLEEIQAAAQHANAAKFIEKLPQGLDTMVGLHGIQMSGGQKQRIAIARAILKDPRILLLDEATSALDAESERIVQEALDAIMVNRTTVIVAHRLSTVKNADKIAVIHQGKIVEEGLHTELLNNPGGVYFELVRLQQLSKESDEHIVDNQDGSGIKTDSGRHSSQSISSLRSISRCSSGLSNSSHHSFSISTGLPTVVNMVDMAVGESQESASMPSKMDHQVPLYRLAYVNKQEIPELLLGSLAAVVTGAILPIFGVILSGAIKTFYEPAYELQKKSRFWALMLIVLGGSSLLATPLKTYFFAVAGCKLIRRIRLKCFERIIHMDISWFDRQENSSGRISSRLAIDATCVRSLVGESLSSLVQNSSTAFAGLAIGFGASWQLSLIVIVMLPLIGLHGYMNMKSLSGFSADAKKLYEDSTQVASDAVGSIRTVASFSAEDKVIQLFKKKCKRPMTLGIKQGLYSGVGYGLSMFFLYSAYATIFYFGARLIKAGNITFGEVFQVFYGLSLAAVSISTSGALSPDTSKGRSGAASIFALLDQKSPIDSSETSGITLDNVKGDILFQHVSFKYPSRPDVPIFEDLCLAIESCKFVVQTLALVGESGSGKSTVISLLQRFYDPNSGEITLDGVEIRRLNLRWLRQQMGLVSQEPVLFNGTIRANIAYGKEDSAREAEIISAAEIANAHKFISSLQQGYDTQVGERGIHLSGGQKQRVAIARAIVRSPKILLLDEATSALDAESEKVVHDALDQAIVGKTTIMVAHRLSTIKCADLIAVIQNGVIKEKGNHESLISMKDGIYASLVEQYASASSM
ncbi:ABC transporter B family member 11-like isoform X1 [Coffea arabica]|uniref:ABC transporter B family member 11-like isoform X1 n=1 Tax=Coffea arabica TaxID=13443 RepID=A0ABM4VHT1_COFAR